MTFEIPLDGVVGISGKTGLRLWSVSDGKSIITFKGLVICELSTEKTVVNKLGLVNSTCVSKQTIEKQQIQSLVNINAMKFSVRVIVKITLVSLVHI